MYLHLSQSPYSRVCQPVASLLLRISSLDTGASIILLLPQVSASGDGAYQAVVSLWVKIKGSPVAGLGTSRAKEALTFT